ncbi:MAG: glycoside hydrolase family 92 protein, partial [Alkalibacterium sp.]|nr:glycoside hydrolase family 92 protein [Alkalibacterium sp.]
DIDLNKREKDEWVKCSEVKSQSVWLSIQTECDNVAFTMGTSFISEKQAEINLSRELDNKSVNELARSSASEWETLLNKIEVSDSDKNKVNLFYQYMYRLFLFPQTYFEEDSNGEPIHYDSYSETVKAGKYFTNNGFWDTYRTVYPLFSLILPEKYQDILEGIGHFYNETGHLPKWLSPDERGLMPGTLINAVLADASLKDIISDNESEFFLNAMIKEATVPSDDERFGRAGLEDMQDLGYVANDKIESVNQTLDNEYSDFCIRQIAKKLNKKEIEQEYTKKALNYQRLFDKETGFMRGKNAEGDFSEQFVPEDWGYDYTEGSAWQNALAFYHDNQGYAELLGGESPFLNHLVELANSDPFFEIGNYGKEIHEMSESAVGGFGQIAISNQPSFHIPYLYAYAKKPEYTQHIVKQLCSHAFSNDFSGFPGDEDNGSMSGWAIFSMIGFYPVCPGTNEYVLGIPQFDKIVLHLKDNKSFEINVMDNVPYFSYVKSIELNGQLYSPLYLMHDDIVQGGEMAIELSMLPSNKIFIDTDLPYSLTNELRD